MARIQLTAYALIHGISPNTARKRAARGAYQTAIKTGRDWTIDEDEPHTDHRQTETVSEESGWRVVGGYDVYCEDGYVLRGTAPDSSGIGEITVYPYRRACGGGWDRETPKIETLRSGLCRGSWIMT